MYKLVVPDKLVDIWESAEAGYFPGDPMRTIAKKDFKNIKDVYKFLEKPDPLVKAIYGEPDAEGKFLFPMMEDPDPGVEPHRGVIGDQSSYWHSETIKEHAALVTYNLREAGVRPLYAAFLGVMHDCGKKYTAMTNYKGEVHHPDHEYVSALLAAAWSKKWYWLLPDNERKLLVSVIYGHMVSLKDWHKGTATSARAEHKYLAEVTKFLNSETDTLKAYGLVCILSACDEGARNGAAVDKVRVSKGKKIIDEVMG